LNTNFTIVRLSNAESPRKEWDSLLQQHPDLIDAEDDDGNTLLHISILNHHREAARRLLDLGASWKIPNHEGMTGRDLAAFPLSLLPRQCDAHLLCEELCEDVDADEQVRWRAKMSLTCSAKMSLTCSSALRGASTSSLTCSQDVAKMSLACSSPSTSSLTCSEDVDAEELAETAPRTERIEIHQVN